MMRVSNTRRLLLRTGFALCALFGIVFGPMWLAIAAALVSSFFFRAWEMLVIALAADLLWLPSAGGFPVPFYLLGAIAVVWLLEPLRREFMQ